jgi:HEAT repeat protein
MTHRAEAQWKREQFMSKHAPGDGCKVLASRDREGAGDVIGRIGEAAKPAVPELVKLLHHHDYMLAETAANALKAIDPAAATKAGGK